MNRLSSQFTVALIMLTLASSPSYAISCSTYLTSAKSSVSAYWNEIIESNGARLLIKPGEPDSGTSYYGFFQNEPIDQTVSPWKSWLTLKPVSYWLGRTLTGQADTRLTFNNGVWSNLLDRPTHWVTRQFSDPALKPTFLAKLPLLFAWGFLTQSYIVEPVTDFAFNYKIESEIASNKVAFDDLIQNDFRFRSIKEELHHGQIDMAMAEHSAYMISQAYSKYYSYRDSKQGVFTADENLKLLNQYLFMHLRDVMTEDIVVPKGFVTTASFKVKISDAQREELFQQNHSLYMRYQLAQVYTMSLSGAGATIPSWLNPYLAEMHQDAFVADLTNLYSSGKISQAQLTAYMMENYFWNCRLSGWDTLGLKKINPETGAPVVLADYQSEMLKEIQAGR